MNHNTKIEKYKIRFIDFLYGLSRFEKTWAFVMLMALFAIIYFFGKILLGIALMVLVIFLSVKIVNGFLLDKN